MKSFHSLSTVEKGKLLFESFPEEVSPFITFIQEKTKELISNPQNLHHSWHPKFISVDFWIKLAEQANTVLRKYKTRITQSSSLFSDQLFDGYLSLYTIHYLELFADQVKTKSYKYFLFTDVLFSTGNCSNSNPGVDYTSISHKLFSNIEFPFSTGEIAQIENNCGSTWIFLKDGSCYSISIVKCEEFT